MTEWISGNVFIRPNVLLKKGDKTVGHKHNFDHTTFVLSGAVHVRGVLPDGKVIERDFFAKISPDDQRCHFLVRAAVEHEITALEDNTTYYCVYSHRTPQGEVSVENTGWGAAYV